MFKNRVCQQCGKEFTPTTAKAKYCKLPIEKICPICGKSFTAICHPKSNTTCDNPECKKRAGTILTKTKICRSCGNPFIPASCRQVDCGKPIQKTCVICGQTFESRCGQRWNRNTCSNPECEKTYQYQKSVESYKGITKQCVLCGKMFTPCNNTQLVCNDQHFRTCKVCGKQFELNHIRGRNINDLPVTCSKECADKLKFANGNPGQIIEYKEKAKATILEKYGVDHPMHSQEIKDKLDATMQDRYGVKRFTQTPEYIDIAKSTNQERYGTDWPMQSSEIQEKAADTLYDHYGVRTPMASAEIKDKVVETYREHTGYDYPLQNPEVLEHLKQTNLEKYGVEYSSQAMEVKEKTKATMLAKYGVINYNQLWGQRSKRMLTPENLDVWKSFVGDPQSFITENFDHKPTYKELAEYIGVSVTAFYPYLSEDDRKELIAVSTSNMENEVITMIKQINPNITIDLHNRKLIAPYELDIYLPEYDFAIECNPTSTHNSSKGSFGDYAKSPSYHKMKTDLCEEKGIFLYHIYGYEWSHKKEIIKSMIANIIGTNTRIYARKCIVVTVPNDQAREFFNMHHRQGHTNASVYLGLQYDDELVSVMSFNKIRYTIGIDKSDLSECWELVRFASKCNTTVIGGADKLFKEFIRKYSPKQVRSFSDRSHTRGTLYKKLGFVEIRRSDANYMWVNTLDDTAYHRINAQKQNIKKFLKDDNIDISQSEFAIMESHGYVRVYDSGTITWEWQSL